MSDFKESVNQFKCDRNLADWQSEKIELWLRQLRVSNVDTRVVSVPKDNLSAAELEQRDHIKAQTIIFIRRYFDDRPEVAHLLDDLFSTFGLVDETKRHAEFFPFDQLYNPEEIMVLLLKRLQNEPGSGRFTREAIAEYFMTSTRTINKYINMMLPADEASSARVLGRIVQMEPAYGTNIPASSTHPVFLPLTMVELYTLVDLLSEHTGNDVEGRIASSILNDIYSQTTDYAKTRLTRLEGLKKALALTPDSSNQPRISGEAIMFREKEAMVSTVRYEEHGVEKACTGVITRNRKDRAVINITDDDNVWSIPFRNIIAFDNPKK